MLKTGLNRKEGEFNHFQELIHKAFLFKISNVTSIFKEEETWT